jgi:putative ABC transport system permease protein
VIEYVLEALRSLRENRLRTILALIGLVVGVGAVIAIQVLGHAMGGAMAGVVKGFSNYTFLMQPDFENGFDQKAGITLHQVQGFNAIPHVAEAIPWNSVALQVHVGSRNAQLTVAPVGGNPNFYPDAFAAGGPITPEQVIDAAPVCVLSADAAKKLNMDPNDLLGREVRAGSIRCGVVGVLTAPPQGALSFDLAPSVSVPYTLYERLYMRGSSKVYVVEAVVDDPSNMASAEDFAKALFSSYSNGKYSYQSLDNQFFTNVFDKVFGIISVVIGAIGSISLVVAGIGIMNILLVSIVERTREIGVRKAIGGTRGQIMLQFIIEAIALTFGGCLLGSALGIGIGWWVNTAYIIKISGVIVPVPWIASLVLAVVFASIITAIFGIYPAYRASRLDPIEALRYE